MKPCMGAIHLAYRNCALAGLCHAGHGSQAERLTAASPRVPAAAPAGANEPPLRHKPNVSIVAIRRKNSPDPFNPDRQAVASLPAATTAIEPGNLLLLLLGNDKPIRAFPTK